MYWATSSVLSFCSISSNKKVWKVWLNVLIKSQPLYDPKLFCLSQIQMHCPILWLQPHFKPMLLFLLHLLLICLINLRRTNLMSSLLPGSCLSFCLAYIVSGPLASSVFPNILPSVSFPLFYFLCQHVYLYLFLHIYKFDLKIPLLSLHICMNL